MIEDLLSAQDSGKNNGEGKKPTGPPTTLEEAVKGFMGMLDGDSSDLVDLEEFKKSIERAAEEFGLPPLGGDFDGVFRYMDVNMDGKISFDEAMMTVGPMLQMGMQ